MVTRASKQSMDKRRNTNDAADVAGDSQAAI